MPAAKFNWYYSVLQCVCKVLKNTRFRVPAASQIQEHMYQGIIAREQDIAVKTSIRKAKQRFTLKQQADISQ